MENTLTNKWVIRICKSCGKEYPILQSQLTRGRGQHCSKACYIKRQRIGQYYTCPNCNKEFYQHPAYARRNKVMCCSRACMKTWRAKNHIAPARIEGNILRGGYPYVWSDHPRAFRGRIAEHILVWEQTHGKRLPKGWIIHHLNGVKDDNRPENLVALKDKKHIRLIPTYRKRVRQLESEIAELKQLRFSLAA